MPVKKKKGTTKRKNKTKPQTDFQINYQYNIIEYRWRQAIMWFGVIILTGAVLFMWFLNTNATFFDVNKNIKKSEEAKILNESAQKIKNILADVDIQEKLESLKIENIKVNPPVTSTAQFEALIKSINEMTSSTQFTNTTINTASSSTNQ